MNPSRFGIRTFGGGCAFMTASWATPSVELKNIAQTAQTSSALRDLAALTPLPGGM